MDMGPGNPLEASILFVLVALSLLAAGGRRTAASRDIWNVWWPKVCRGPPERSEVIGSRRWMH